MSQYWPHLAGGIVTSGIVGGGTAYGVKRRRKRRRNKHKRHSLRKVETDLADTNTDFLLEEPISEVRVQFSKRLVKTIL